MKHRRTKHPGLAYEKLPESQNTIIAPEGPENESCKFHQLGRLDFGFLQVCINAPSPSCRANWSQQTNNKFAPEAMDGWSR